MTRYADRSFDWVAGLAFASGVVVIIPSIAAATVAVVAVILALV